MIPQIEILQEKKLIGKSVRTTLATDNPFSLWSSFMPRRKEILNAIDQNLYSIQEYDNLTSFNDFKRTMAFTKWAAIETPDFNLVPEGMETLLVPEGLYAVFVHRGLQSAFQNTIQYIYGEWLPKSSYDIDHRPHFELLGEKYKSNHPGSEEEVWIPIKEK